MQKRFTCFVLLFLCVMVAQAQKSPLKVMTYNIRYNNPEDGPNAWPERKANLIAFLNEEKPDILCVQEALEDQMEDLALGLSGYAWIGRGREKNKKKGEFAAIFYRTERVFMRDEGNFWLSDSPDSPGSVGWDAALPRITTWGYFRDELTGKSFYAFNTHFDHQGVKARQQSSKLLVSKSKKISSRYPAIICGDLNMEPADENLKNFEIAGLTDARTASASEAKGPEATHFGFSTESETGKRIDYIFFRNDVTVQSYEVLTPSTNGNYLSDHLPVMAEVEIGN